MQITDSFQETETTMAKPNIVILEAYPVDADGLSWDSFAKLGNLTVYERTHEDELKGRVDDADIIVSSKIHWNDKTLPVAP